MQVQKLVVEQGQHVSAGDLLCVLANHAELDIQGRAFEQDIPVLARAAKNGWPVTAVFQTTDKRSSKIPGLRILYLASEVDMKSRAFCFYLKLPNEMVRDTKNDRGRRFVDWRFKPGQRLRLQVPTEPAAERIVLPVEAVVTEGTEGFVFEYHQDHFDRRNVHVTYRDQDHAVIDGDGSLTTGVKVAVAGAYQIYLSIKNNEGEGVDPHAGHHH